MPKTGGEMLRLAEIRPKEICEVCGGDIEIQIFRGSGVCCENCRAIKSGDFKQVTH